MAYDKVVDSAALDTQLASIADAIRDNTGGTDALTLEGMAESIPDVYEAGKKAEHDAFWDVYQSGGTRLDYSLGFAGRGWTDSTFSPKYDIVPTYSYDIFKLCNITDLEALLRKCNVVLDLSHSGRASGAFDTADRLTVVPEIDVSSTTYVSLTAIFLNCRSLHTIRKLVLKSDGSNTFSSSFNNCGSLTSIVIEGLIGANIDFHWSPLSKDSILSVINALSNNKTGLTVTLSLTAVNNAFETSEGVCDGSTSEEWEALIATKPNWTISLA